ncbi:aromatic acid/H+ symport family MFS transporter [Nocardioides sp. LMS-CY]|uniref:MFS transporter n=1 Tax=Nocardioides sp. (strain LMS-CY) TaxID=2840457 RepID=UPI001C008EB3|nr:aromatic acid/H+ symport family MFS transporter [Nocardioides sp. LMS-CY]QWF20482.1 aromatic acid/H+ symport family MFS transporter [Nocardioides sp. LMS-CY]
MVHPTPPARTRADRMSGAQITAVSICLLIAILDGLDAQLIAYAAPSIVKEFGFGPASFGVVFSSSLLGMAIGSVIFGMLADYVGRKRIMIIATLIFAVTTLLIPVYADSIASFVAIRFVAGIGLGGVTPSLIAMIAENTPSRVRSMSVTIAVGCLSLGAFVGGLIARWLIPAEGWRSVFVLGGAIPLVLAVVMIVGLRRLDERASLEEPEPEQSSSPVELFRSGRAASTIVIWIVFFANLLLMYALLNWLPTLFVKAGYSSATATIGGSLFALGGFAGGVVIGVIMDRIARTHAILVAGYSIGLVGIAMVALADSTGVLMTGIVLAGIGVIGGQTGISALAVALYPANIRGAGVGWAYAVGRVGSIAGPTISGFLVASGLQPNAIIGAGAIPAVVAGAGVATLAALAVRRVRQRGTVASQATA